MVGQLQGWRERFAARARVDLGGDIAAILALANADDVISFGGGFPDPETFPRESLADLLRELLGSGDPSTLQYSPVEGLPGTRSYLRERLAVLEGLEPAEPELMVTSGGIDALNLLGTTFVDPGDHVVVEAPTYLGAVMGFRRLDARIVGVPLDDDGLRVDDLEAQVTAGLRPKLLYTIPDHQNPAGVSLSADRRPALVDLARRAGFLIVEDVAYRELGFTDERLPSLWSLGPDVTVQIGTFSKTFFPGVRLGWAAGPRDVIEALVAAKQLADQCAGGPGPAPARGVRTPRPPGRPDPPGSSAVPASVRTDAGRAGRLHAGGRRLDAARRRLLLLGDAAGGDRCDDAGARGDGARGRVRAGSAVLPRRQRPEHHPARLLQGARRADRRRRGPPGRVDRVEAHARSVSGHPPAGTPSGQAAPSWRAVFRGRGRLTGGLVLLETVTAVQLLIVITIMPVVARDLGGLRFYGLAFAAAAIAAIVALPATGQTAIGGVRPGRSRWCWPVFVAGTILAAAAPSMLVFVIGRFLQGWGLGAQYAVSLGAVAQTYPDDYRPRVLALLSAAWVVPSLIGPSIGALIAATLGWRWAFIASLPFVAVAAWMVLPELAHLRRAPSGALDRVGVRWLVQLAVGAAALLYGLTVLRWWTAPLAAAGLALLIPALRRVLPSGSFTARRGLPAAASASFLVAFAFFGMDGFIPLMLTGVRGRSVAVAGLVITLASVAWSLGSWWQSRVAARRSRAALTMVGTVLILAGSVAMVAGLAQSVSLVLPYLGWTVAGFGMGVAYPTITLVGWNRRRPAGRRSPSRRSSCRRPWGQPWARGSAGARWRWRPRSAPRWPRGSRARSPSAWRPDCCCCRSPPACPIRRRARAWPVDRPPGPRKLRGGLERPPGPTAPP
jgi:MFS family permease